MSDSMNIISANLVAPAPQMKPLTPVDGHICVARELLQAVEELSTVREISPRGCALIAAQSLECTLKAFLWHKNELKGISEKDIKKILENDPGVRHNLETLWDMAYGENLNIAKDHPDWVKILNSEFYLRYQKGKRGNIVHGGQTPSLISMAKELKGLIGNVEMLLRHV